MDDDLWRHSETDFRRTLLGLLERIAEALESAPVNLTINELSPDAADILRRGLKDLDEGRVRSFGPVR